MPDDIDRSMNAIESPDAPQTTEDLWQEGYNTALREAADTLAAEGREDCAARVLGLRPDPETK